MNSNSKRPRPEYKFDKCEGSGRYLVVGNQMACCRHILTGLYTDTKAKFVTQISKTKLVTQTSYTDVKQNLSHRCL